MVFLSQGCATGMREVQFDKQDHVEAQRLFEAGGAMHTGDANACNDAQRSRGSGIEEDRERYRDIAEPGSGTRKVHGNSEREGLRRDRGWEDQRYRCNSANN
jgi:hypothetical protein